MKCQHCGAESGPYQLCRACNIKKENGDIIKCSVCGNWHAPTAPCPETKKPEPSNDIPYVYNAKKLLISNSEQSYYTAIVSSLPENYHAFPQVNLASFVSKNDNSPFHNELFRNVDFLITDEKYKPLFLIEINDQSHLTKDRKERDEKVQKICEEAGLPIVKFWTSYGVNAEYINKKINETIGSLPVARVHHFNPKGTETPAPQSAPAVNGKASSRKKSGCYVATCVYGSYNCPEVWVLRRYRDTQLASTWYGKLFIKTYYLVSPTLVRLFGKRKFFHNIFRPRLDKLVTKLSSQGIQNTPYEDTNWN